VNATKLTSATMENDLAIGTTIFNNNKNTIGPPLAPVIM